ncbi:hypothetical protein [Anaerostipes faecalis]|uniref:hypothetical protein n=1 Tax=Anaerostipes faecalis TaxID=2738446 RepID=UPI003F11ABAB
MEKIVMHLKRVIILLCGIVLGYLTSKRTDMSISLECIFGDGILIVLCITIIMVITKEKIKLGINCAIFGLSFVIGATWIKNIELFLGFGKQNYDYILYGLGEAIIIPVIFWGLGMILYYYHKEGILSLILSGLPVMYCSFTLISYQWEGQFLLGIIINLLTLIIVFCFTGKKYMKYKIIFIVLGGMLGFFYFV